jgi:hypothetical protein
VADNVAQVAGVEVSTDHWIDGRRVASSQRFSDLSPVDGSHLADVSAGGQAEADMAVAAARKAFPAWAALGPQGRLPILKRFAEGIRARAKELAAVETMDNGSLLAGNVHRVVPRAAQNIEFFADWALTLEGHSIDSAEVVNHVRYDPSGVAGLIAPSKTSSSCPSTSHLISRRRSVCLRRKNSSSVTACTCSEYESASDACSAICAPGELWPAGAGTRKFRMRDCEETACCSRCTFFQPARDRIASR